MIQFTMHEERMELVLHGLVFLDTSILMKVIECIVEHWLIFWICQFLLFNLISELIWILLLIAGNIATLCVLFTTDLGFKSSFNRLISNLCIFDTFCIVLNTTIFTFPLLSETYRHQILPALLPIVLPLAQISLTGSVYTVVAVALERFIAVKR